MALPITYAFPADFDLMDYLGEGWGIMRNTGDPEVEVALRPPKGSDNRLHRAAIGEQRDDDDASAGEGDERRASASSH